MTTQQAQQLAAEAEALVERLTAAYFDARKAKDMPRRRRVIMARTVAVRRWLRRYEAWAIMSYGPAVQS